MTSRKKSRCRSKADPVQLLTKEIKWSFKGKAEPAVFWVVVRRRNGPANGTGEPARILALGVEQAALRD